MLHGKENLIERFDIVDPNDSVIRSAVLESDIHMNDDITRVVTVYVFDAQGKFYIAQRSPNKVVDPLKFEAPAHGRVNSGENYEDAGMREAKEELGVVLENLECLGHYYISFESNVGLRQHFKKLFIAHTKEQITPDREEIYSIKSFPSVEDFLQFYEENINLFSDAMYKDIQNIKHYFRK